ncbi:MAG: DNA polymerase III subunit delta [Clostridia bacterium]|nr:DNA polymerase III subunit delta [Clostridia bacterium]
MKKLETQTTLMPVYRLTGNDILGLDKALKHIEDKAKIEMPELNKAVFNDENFDAEKIILSCQQMPLMSEKRLVVVKNVAKIKDADLKKLEEYCKAPALETILVFQEIVGQNVFAKLSAEKVLCNKLSEGELSQIIESKFKESGKSISLGAVALLIDFCGSDQMRIRNELSKLLYAGKDEITESDIKKMVKKSDEYSVFEITSALSSGNGDKAITLMKKMLETMEFPVILGLISAHYRRVLYAGLAEGTNAEIAKHLGVKEFAISKAKGIAKNLSPAKILKISNLILDVDYDIKSGKMNAENAMYYLVFQIISITKGEEK